MQLAQSIRGEPGVLKFHEARMVVLFRSEAQLFKPSLFAKQRPNPQPSSAPDGKFSTSRVLQGRLCSAWSAEQQEWFLSPSTFTNMSFWAMKDHSCHQERAWTPKRCVDIHWTCTIFRKYTGNYQVTLPSFRPWHRCSNIILRTYKFDINATNTPRYFLGAPAALEPPSVHDDQ